MSGLRTVTEVAAGALLFAAMMFAVFWGTPLVLVALGVAP
jgi:hypothetical protein